MRTKHWQKCRANSAQYGHIGNKSKIFISEFVDGYGLMDFEKHEVYKLSNYFLDYLNPSESELLMFELTTGLPKEHYLDWLDGQVRGLFTDEYKPEGWYLRKDEYRFTDYMKGDSLDTNRAAITIDWYEGTLIDNDNGVNVNLRSCFKNMFEPPAQDVNKFFDIYKIDLKGAFEIHSKNLSLIHSPVCYRTTK